MAELCAAPQNDLLCLHYYFSPWNEAMRRRALRTGDLLSARERLRCPDTTHLIYQKDPRQMERERRRLAKKSRDLSRDAIFRRNALGLSEL